MASRSTILTHIAVPFVLTATMAASLALWTTHSLRKRKRRLRQKLNFLIQWHPESMLTMEIAPSRPRVYLIDFEVAIEFPPERPVDECLITGYPLGGSFTDITRYTRAHAPECASGEPYSPFKLSLISAID
jgi:hypothetical protein